MHKLKVITSTIREGRKGPSVAAWVLEQLEKLNVNRDFEVELLELGAVNLPFSTEPIPPGYHKYQHESTIKWAEKIGEADAFIFVLAEYNHSFPAPIKNAIDTVGSEWYDKPVAFVSYGGLSGGTRSMVGLLPALATNRLHALTSSATNFPFFEQHINEEGKFVPDEHGEKSFARTLADLTRWTGILSEARKK